MKFLIDNALSPKLAALLVEAGHDAVHVRAVGLARAEDPEVLRHAALEERVLVSADTDFSTILALRSQAKPSFILFRGAQERRPEEQATLLLGKLPIMQPYLGSGAVVVISPDRIRIRNFPSCARRRSVPNRF